MTPTPSSLFTLPDAWTGGSYELTLLLGPRDDHRLRSALQAVWSFGELEGCWERGDLEPEAQIRVPAAVEVTGGEAGNALLRGRARLPPGVVVACCTYALRLAVGGDWISFGLPMGSLGRAYPVGAFPWEDGTSLDWREGLDDWLRALAAHVYARQPFQLALVGFTDADPEPDRVLTEGVPDRRWVGYLLPEGGALRWFAPTEGAPIRSSRE